MCQNQIQTGEETPESEGNGNGDTQAAREERERGQQTTREGGETPPMRYWQATTIDEAIRLTDTMYNKIVTFSPSNIFEIPKCNAAKEFIKEINFLLREYIHASHLQPLAFKAIAILPHLICQRTHSKSKTTENVKAMERRMEMWKKGEITDLLRETQALQNKRRKTAANQIQRDIARRFSSMIKQGKISQATRALLSEDSHGTLPLDEATCQALSDKHPPAKEADAEATYQGEYIPPPPVIFDRITGERIWKHALHTHGAAGPSGMDAKSWKNILSHVKFGSVAGDLCNTIAALARKMATENCPDLAALTACRLIALDKKPGCRPIGIGEVLRRIIGKAVMEVVKDDITSAVGNLQVCAGQKAGCEAAIHAMRKIFDEPDCDAVLMVDASNAFNNINRKVTLHNTRIKCPSFARYIENLYSHPAKQFVSDRETGRCEIIDSAEGTTQGDPVAMAMYAIGLLKLQDRISHEKTQVKHVAYADDITGAGKIEDIKKWWDEIVLYGPMQGYYPNAQKTVLIVKPQKLDLAKEKFKNTDITIKTGGEKHLGAILGPMHDREKFIKDRVEEWVNEIRRLAKIATIEPHAAYTALTFGIRHRWNYLMRTVPGIGHLLEPLEQTIKRELLPALAGGRNPTDVERSIFELPPRKGGLGIPNPCKLADIEYENSIKLTAGLTQQIINQNKHGEINLAEQQKIRTEITRNREQKQEEQLHHLSQQLPEDAKRRLQMTQEVGASNWLTTLPIRVKGFSLNRQDFIDALALRYGWPMDGLPQHCACGSPFDSNHAMICKTGGFVVIRHDEVRDLTAQMLREVCHDVRVEPELLSTGGRNFDLRSTNTTEDARLDVSARGFWARGQRAFFDVRVFNPMAPSNRGQQLKAAHLRHENEKMREYGERIQEVEQGSFTPLVFTTAGGMASRATTFYAILAQQLADKKRQAKSNVTAWMRCRLSFSLLRSALLCLRGTRTKPPAYTSIRDTDFEETVQECRIGD